MKTERHALREPSIKSRLASFHLDRRILLDALFATIIAVCLIYARERFAKDTQLGQRVEFATYELIQYILSSKPVPKSIPIAIVDLSDLHYEPLKGARRGEQFTPRESLKVILKKLTALGPKAIGVDMDFSPRQTYRTPEDPGFFEFCIQLSKDSHVPIYLGVGSRQSRPRWEWLLNPDYQELGVSILVPRYQTQYMVNCFQLHTMSDCGPALSEELAKKLKPPPLHFVARHPTFFEEVPRRELSNNISVGTFPVDYSALDILRTSGHTIFSLQTKMLEDNAELIERSVVLLGDVKAPAGSDEFRVPGRFELVPGVYIHASALYTLSQAPLYVLTPRARWIVDLSLAMFIIIVLTSVRLWHGNLGRPEVTIHALQWGLTAMVVIAVLLIGAIVVHRTRLLWDDFILVIFTFVMHPACERWISSMAGGLRRVVQTSCNKFISHPAEK